MCTFIEQKQFCDTYKLDTVFLHDLRKFKDALTLFLKKGMIIDLKKLKDFSEGLKNFKDYISIAPNYIWKSPNALRDAQSLLVEMSSICEKVCYLFEECDKIQQKREVEPALVPLAAAGGSAVIQRSTSPESLRELAQKTKLVKQDIIINARRIQDKKTALHLAVEHKHSLLAFLLILSGANLDMVDKNGQTARSVLTPALEDLVSICGRIKRIKQQYLILEKREENMKSLEDIRSGPVKTLITKIIKWQEKVEMLNKVVRDDAKKIIEVIDHDINDDIVLIREALYFKLGFLYNFKSMNSSKVASNLNQEFKSVLQKALEKISQSSPCYQEANGILSIMNASDESQAASLEETIRRKKACIIIFMLFLLAVYSRLRKRKKLLT